MINEFLIRIGSFFIWLGIGLIILFAASYLNNTPEFMYFFLGLISIFGGARLYRRKAPPPPSGRFAMLHRMRTGPKNERCESKEEKK